VLSAERYGTVVDEFRALMEGRFGTPPAPADPTVQRAVALIAGDEPEQELTNMAALREEAEGLASSEEELILLAMFGQEAEPLLRAVRARATGEESLVGGAVDQSRAQQIREIVRVVQESGVAEVTIEEGDLRVTVRRSEERPAVALPATAGEPATTAPEVAAPETNGFVRVEAPMVGTFYRAPEPGAAPFVEEGDVVAPGQTLCILEAMKLMNHVKAELAGIVRKIAVGNGESVEFGQLLFELEPAVGRPLDAL
jgi:oxaloacetate decarboxylase (Na+ extruding) subunit alpha